MNTTTLTDLDRLEEEERSEALYAYAAILEEARYQQQLSEARRIDRELRWQMVPAVERRANRGTW